MSQFKLALRIRPANLNSFAVVTMVGKKIAEDYLKSLFEQVKRHGITTISGVELNAAEGLSQLVTDLIVESGVSSPEQVRE